MWCNQATKIQRNFHQHLVLVALSLNLISRVTCLPNIRIQVNNENLQSPPYLLQAIKQAELYQNSTNETASRAGNSQVVPVSPTGQPPTASAAANKTNDDESAAPSSGGAGDDDGSGNNNFSVVKEETIEEILDLDPESVLKLAPEHLIEAAQHSAGDSQPQLGSDMASAETTTNQKVTRPKDDHFELTSSVESFMSVKQDKKAQLPVTSSHLKKPAGASVVDEPEQSAQPGSSLGSGAKSLISPSVASEDATIPPSQNTNQLRKHNAPLPDTLEPSQVMNGVTNASLVPATITREYGHHSRTRVTLGGGYVRDKSPPLVNPASDGYQDNRPEKPVVPLEKPHLNPPKGPQEDSRIVEVPERIVIPMSVFNQEGQGKQQAINTANKQLISTNQTTVAKKRKDNRCPSEGVTTFEHPSACDKYYYCEDGIISEQTCPNGLLYGTRDIVKDFCVHRWKVVCGEKSIPNPISSPGCRWQFGIFNVQGSPRCSPDFYECYEGVFAVKKCSIEGQVYDDRTKSCQFAEQIGCKSEALADFKCPPDDQGNTYWPFPRYFLNERSLIHCINDKPEIVRCRDDERVDPEHLHCIPLEKLPLASGVDNSEGSLTARRREKKKKPHTNDSSSGSSES